MNFSAHLDIPCVNVKFRGCPLGARLAALLRAGHVEVAATIERNEKFNITI